ncbi:MAG: alkaline phosphatase family protein [Stenotrophomonas sp.]
MCARSTCAPSSPSITFPNHYTLVSGLRPDHHRVISHFRTDPQVPGPRFTWAGWISPTCAPAPRSMPCPVVSHRLPNCRANFFICNA